jgi:hypothetical protein
MAGMGESDRPQVTNYGPEVPTPVGEGRTWPWWAWLAVLVLSIAFIVWAQGTVPWP